MLAASDPAVPRDVVEAALPGVFDAEASGVFDAEPSGVFDAEPSGVFDAEPSGVFDALGDPTRRRLLELLAGTERPVAELVAALRERGPISQPAVSQHLRVLREAGLVTVRAEGTRRFHAVDHAGLAAAQDWLARLVDLFDQPLDALATEVARGRRAHRTTSSADDHGLPVAPTRRVAHPGP